MHHKVRELLVAQRTQLLNALRSHLAEIGIIAAQGPNNARALAVLIMESNDMIPAIVRPALGTNSIMRSDKAIRPFWLSPEPMTPRAV